MAEVKSEREKLAASAESLQSLLSMFAEAEITSAPLVRSGGAQTLWERFEKSEGSLLRALVEHAPEGIVVMVPRSGGDEPRIVYVNDGFCRMTGLTREEVVGESPKIFGVAESDRAVLDAMLHPLCQRKPFRGEAMAFRKGGSRYALELLVVPMMDSAGELTHWGAYMRDVSERKAQIQALEHQSLHDVLTDLPNRVLLRDRLDQAVIAARRDGFSVGLLTIDLDRFKEVNDVYGHHFGDLLLREIAPRLRAVLHPNDTIARLGGDEFAILLPAIGDARDAIRAARKVLKIFERPFHVEGGSLSITGSIGVAVAPEHGEDGASLMRRSEIAMYAAKQTRSGFLLYSLQVDSRSVDAISMKLDLREAIEQNQLLLYYQPKVHMRSGLVTRVEALVRWRHPELGLILPDQFIPIAERTALIKSLTDWVLDDALAQCRRWHDKGFPLHIAVNLSTHSLQEPFLPERILKLLEKWGVEPRALKLEITESSILADPPHVLAILTLLRSLGVRLSLDDFGTGYSSLVHLKLLPVDEIKIDKSFVMGMSKNRADAAIVRSTIDLAHNLGRDVVAEGVNDEATYRTLAELGCDLAQGYYLSPPLPPDELVVWLEESRWGMSAGKS